MYVFQHKSSQNICEHVNVLQVSPKNVFSKSPLGMGTHQIALHKIGGLHSGGTDISYIFITTVTVGVHQMMSVKHAHIHATNNP